MVIMSKQSETDLQTVIRSFWAKFQGMQAAPKETGTHLADSHFAQYFVTQCKCG